MYFVQYLIIFCTLLKADIKFLLQIYILVVVYESQSVLCYVKSLCRYSIFLQISVTVFTIWCIQSNVHTTSLVHVKNVHATSVYAEPILENKGMLAV